MNPTYDEGEKFVMTMLGLQNCFVFLGYTGGDERIPDLRIAAVNTARGGALPMVLAAAAPFRPVDAIRGWPYSDEIKPAVQFAIDFADRLQAGGDAWDWIDRAFFGRLVAVGITISKSVSAAFHHRHERAAIQAELEDGYTTPNAVAAERNITAVNVRRWCKKYGGKWGCRLVDGEWLIPATAAMNFPTTWTKRTPISRAKRIAAEHNAAFRRDNNI